MTDVDEALIARYVEWRSGQVGVTTVNRALATLRRSLRLAQEWRIIDRVPRIRMLAGERVRDFVLDRRAEAVYLAACSEPLRTVACFLLQTGLRVGELLQLRWDDVHLEAVGGATRGYIHVRCGKSRNAKRNISLTREAQDVLAKQSQFSGSALVFVRDDHVSALSRFTLDHQHQKVRTLMGLPDDFVLHSFRHTMLTRLGECGADAFTIMRIAGHSSVTVSQRYVHPTPETLERAFDRLEEANRADLRKRNSSLATKTATEESTAVLLAH